jgi:hypothetical protein
MAGDVLVTCSITRLCAHGNRFSDVHL